MSIPTDRRYTTDHEWVTVDDDVATIGITAFAAEELGGVTYVDLPEVGTRVEAGRQCGEIESTKTVEELSSPVTGTVTSVNAAAVEDPDVVGADPYRRGWLFTVEVDGDIDASGLLDAAGYAEHLAK